MLTVAQCIGLPARRELARFGFEVSRSGVLRWLIAAADFRTFWRVSPCLQLTARMRSFLFRDALVREG
jgi:hypothetical protein